MALRLTVAGAMAAIRRQPLRAAMLWGAAEHGYAQIGVDDRPIHARLLARWEPQARADASDEAGWDAAWTAGAQMTIEDALAVAADWSEHTETAHQTWLKPPASV